MASSYAKEHPEFMSEAKNITFLFQQNHPGYKALWQQILKVSIDDLKKNYTALNVHFDLWKNEDGQEYATVDLCCEIPVQCLEVI